MCRRSRILAAYGAIGLVVDLVLKLALSRPCGRLIATAIDLDAAKANRPTGQAAGAPPRLMRTLFHPTLLYPPTGDPGAWIDLPDEGRAVLSTSRRSRRFRHADC